MKENPAVILKAQTQTARDFARTLATGHQTTKPERPVDTSVILESPVHPGQRRTIERGLNLWQREHGIDDPALALEMMLGRV